MTFDKVTMACILASVTQRWTPFDVCFIGVAESGISPYVACWWNCVYRIFVPSHMVSLVYMILVTLYITLTTASFLYLLYQGGFGRNALWLVHGFDCALTFTDCRNHESEHWDICWFTVFIRLAWFGAEVFKLRVRVRIQTDAFLFRFAWPLSRRSSHPLRITTGLQG